MSTIIMAQCWPLQMSATQKAVLISLADQANDDGVCWPAVGTISERTCISERSVQDALKWLETHSAIQREHRNQRSTIYTVTPATYTGKAAVTAHYVYRIEHKPSGRFFVGLRSSVTAPDQDAEFWGTGAPAVWFKQNRADCVKTVLASFPTRRAATEYESLETATHIMNPLCLNRRGSIEGGKPGANNLGANAAPAATAPANGAPPAAPAPVGANAAPATPQTPREVGAAAAPGTVMEPPEGTAKESLPPAKPAAPDAETAFQAACRETWSAYKEAYAIRYGTPPIRDAKVNSQIKQFVSRIGHDESPAVARFYVERVNEAYITRQVHDLGLLVKGASGYRTQWATNTTMTATRARQMDQSQTNHDAADEAVQILRQRQQEGKC